MIKMKVMLTSRTNAIHLARFVSAFVPLKAENKSYKLVVVGGGAGGCSAAAKFSKKLRKGQVAVIEPADVHYNQSLWTLAGGGLMPLSMSGKPMGSVLPKDAEWLKTSAAAFDPKNNMVITEDGQRISYEYLVVAMGMQMNYENIKGAKEALEKCPQVCTNYDFKYVKKTLEAIKNFKSGNAIFTFPKAPIKCPGAPQKIAYITERQLVQAGKRDQANIMYMTTLPVLFVVKKYADALWKVVESRGIVAQLNTNLIEVKADTREAVFEDVTDPAKPHQVIPFEMLHLTPPMGPPDVLKAAIDTKLVNADGYVDVNPKTLQHNVYKNIFSIGDCNSVPTSKTAAAVAGQLGILRQNLWAVMQGKTKLTAEYDGYTSCPLVLGSGECILAEFDHSTPPQPMETLPINQAKPMWLSYQLKSTLMPQIYWQMLKGRWEGPRYIRKAFHLGMGR